MVLGKDLNPKVGETKTAFQAADTKDTWLEKRLEKQKEGTKASMDEIASLNSSVKALAAVLDDRARTIYVALAVTSAIVSSNGPRYNLDIKSAPQTPTTTRLCLDR